MAKQKAGASRKTEGAPKHQGAIGRQWRALPFVARLCLVWGAGVQVWGAAYAFQAKTGPVGERAEAALFLLLFGIPPYIVYAVAARLMRNSYAVGLPGFVFVAMHSALYLQVFVFPQNPTDAIGIVFLPGVLVLFVLPLGVLLGWLIGKGVARFRRG